MILRAAFRANRKPARFWFAWRPVRTQCGALVWLEVVECVRGYQVGDTPKRRGGAWTEYRLAHECSACHGKGWNDEWKAVRGHYMGGEVFRVQCDACEGGGK